MQKVKDHIYKTDSHEKNLFSSRKRSEFESRWLPNLLYRKSPLNLFLRFNENSVSRSPKITPPTSNTLPMPTTPMKQNKFRRPVDLKPKKLTFLDEDRDAYFEDSGIHVATASSFSGLHNNTQNNTIKAGKKVGNQTLKKSRQPVNDKENIENAVDNSRQKTSSLAPTRKSARLQWEKKLCSLQRERAIGVWVQCCYKNCKKWRYVAEYQDPTEVPKVWYCRMNSDKTRAKCDAPEEQLTYDAETEVIENKYNAGSIVWVWIAGYPWWPAIVDYCPETFNFYELAQKSNKPRKYHVTFFDGEEIMHNWVSTSKIKPFATNEYKKMIQRTTRRGTDYKERLEKANEMATIANSIPLSERLEKYSFIALYNKLHGLSQDSALESDTVEMDTTSDKEEDIIPASLTSKYSTLWNRRILRSTNLPYVI